MPRHRTQGAHQLQDAYITVTPLFSVCEKHGYLRGRHDFCPLCDQELIDRARTEEQPELPLF